MRLIRTAMRIKSFLWYFLIYRWADEDDCFVAFLSVVFMS